MRCGGLFRRWHCHYCSLAHIVTTAGLKVGCIVTFAWIALGLAPEASAVLILLGIIWVDIDIEFECHWGVFSRRSNFSRSGPYALPSTHSTILLVARPPQDRWTGLFGLASTTMWSGSGRVCFVHSISRFINVRNTQCLRRYVSETDIDRGSI